MANVIQFTILGIDKASPVFKRFATSMGGVASNVTQKFRALQAQATSLYGALAALGGVAVAKSFINAASTSENLRVRLTALLGSVAEGNRLFEEMVHFAGQVPFEYEEIMNSATTLAGVVKGGVDEVTNLMPMITDLAAVSGLTMQQTTEQVVRMFSAGAGSADLFRERGILAMLGFEAGVKISAEETRKTLIRAWEDPESKFRGVTAELATTWDGLMSMMSDKWFQFRTTVMDAGVFNFLKALAITFNNDMGQGLEESRARAEQWANTIIDGIRAVMRGVAVMANGFRGLQVIWASLLVAWEGVKFAILAAITAIATKLENFINSTIEAIDWLTSKIPGIGENFKLGEEAMVDFTSTLIDSMDESGAAIDEAVQNWHNLMMEPIPSEAIENFMANVELKYQELQEKTAEMMAATSDNLTATVETATEKTNEAAEQVAAFAESMSTQVGNAVAGVLVDGGKMSDALKRVFSRMITQMIGSFISLKIHRAIGAKMTVGEAGANAMATMSAAPFPINLTAPAVAAAHSAIAAGYAGSVAALHGGMDFVPSESTYLLNRGERVLSPRQNRDLTGFLNGQGDGAAASASIENVTVNIYTTASTFADIEDDELEEFISGRLIRALDRLDQQGIRQRALERSNA